MNTLIVLSQIITAVATAIIAINAYSSYKLAKSIKKVAIQQQKNLNNFTIANITACLLIAQYSSTGQNSINIALFDEKFKSVEEYLSKKISKNFNENAVDKNR